jgi:hypothetical protein
MKPIFVKSQKSWQQRPYDGHFEPVETMWFHWSPSKTVNPADFNVNTQYFSLPFKFKIVSQVGAEYQVVATSKIASRKDG